MDDHFAFRFRGVIEVPTSGQWTFYLSSDDGSQLFIDNQLVVDNDGLHGPGDVGAGISLDAGYHDIMVTMFERDGGEVLNVSWEGPGVSRQTVPANRLFRSAPSVQQNRAPILAAPGDRSVGLGSIDLPLQAYDADGDLLYFDSAGLPAGLSIDRITGRIFGDLSATALGIYPVTVSASDGAEIAVVSFTMTVLDALTANLAPYLIGGRDQFGR